jgi:hypothetical protein
LERSGRCCQAFAQGRGGLNPCTDWQRNNAVKVKLIAKLSAKARPKANAKPEGSRAPLEDLPIDNLNFKAITCDYSKPLSVPGALNVTVFPFNSKFIFDVAQALKSKRWLDSFAGSGA